MSIYVIQFPNPREPFIRIKVEQLIAAGVEVTVFTDIPAEQPHHAPTITGPGRAPWQVIAKALRHPLEWLRFAYYHWRQRHHIPTHFLKALYANIHFLGHRCDILHAAFDAQAPNVAYLKGYLGCKCVVSIRGSSLWANLPPSIRRELYTQVDGAHMVADALQPTELPQHVTIAIIGPWIDPQRFTPAPPPPHPTVLTIGRLRYEKGYADALYAIREARRIVPYLHYIIIGEGPYRPQLETLIEEYSLHTTVQLVGHVPHTEIPTYMHQATVMLHLSHTEGLSEATIEAQMAGIPVISTSVGGQAEGIIHGVTGYLVPSHQPEQAIPHLIDLLTTPHPHMRQAAHAHALEHFSTEKQLQKLLTFYREVIA